MNSRTCGRRMLGIGVGLLVLAAAGASAGELWAWGGNANRQLGLGHTNACLVPVRCPAVGPVKAVAGEKDSSVFVEPVLGQVRMVSWYYPTPTNIWFTSDGLTGLLWGVTRVSCGVEFRLALLANQTVVAWGANDRGQCGMSPPVGVVPSRVIPNLNGVVRIAAGYDHGLALTGDGKVYSWGANTYGQLGLGAGMGDQWQPLQVPSLPEIAAIAAGGGHSLAVTRDGKVYSWGKNNDGQLGLGHTQQRNTPHLISNLSGATDVAAGAAHSLALAGGLVYAWGGNGEGQLGLGQHVLQTLEPAMVQAGWVSAIASWGYHCLAIYSGGRVLAWGDNGSGQCGLGHRQDVWTPTEIPGLSGVSDVATGDYHSFAIAEPSLWSGATDIGGGWRWLAWFGYFAPTTGGYIYHGEHGWLYTSSTTQADLWFWSPRLGWLWTSNAVYPSFWSVTRNTWLYYFVSSGNGSGGWFYNWSAGQNQWL